MPAPEIDSCDPGETVANSSMSNAGLDATKPLQNAGLASRLALINWTPILKMARWEFWRLIGGDRPVVPRRAIAPARSGATSGSWRTTARSD
jgi:hypothetical protein